MKKITLLFSLLLFCAAIYGQGGWIREYGRSSLHTSKVYQTADGGYILITDRELVKVDWEGYASWWKPLSRGVEVAVVQNGYKVLDEFFVRFFNLNGDQVSVTTLQTPNSSSGPIKTEDFELTADGGYLVIGNTNTEEDDYNQNYPSYYQKQTGLIARYDNAGELTSYNFYAPAGDTSVFLRHLLPANDGDYVVWGASALLIAESIRRIDTVSALFLKATETASIKWAKSPVKLRSYSLTDIRKTYDNAYLAVIKNGWNYGAVVTKIDNSGAAIWESATDKNFSSLSVNKDLTFVLIGDKTGFNDGVSALEIAKYKNTLANQVWSKSLLQAENNHYYFPQHLITTGDGGYATSGLIDIPQFTKKENGSSLTNGQRIRVKEPFLAKFDKDGNIYNSVIGGKVYKDSAKNCTFDDGDQSLSRVLIRVQANDGKSFAAYTDNSGYYSFQVDTGSYIVSAHHNGSKHEPLICPATPGTHKVAIKKDSIVRDVDFAYAYNPGVRDLAIYLSGSSFSLNRGGTYYISYQNLGTQVESGTITLSYNPALKFVYATDSVVSVLGSLLTLSYSNLQPGETRWLYAYFTVPATFKIDDILEATVTIDPTPSDKNPLDNVSKTETRVRASSDPNAKFVSPEGIGEAGLIKPRTDLLYTVKFQNVGNDIALRVEIRDTLDKTLDISTLRILGVSHNYDLTISYPNVIIFTFPNIQLPDSTTDLDGSQGFLQYAITPYKNAPIGDIITNTAHIYFDFNEPVVTNTTINVIDDGTSNIAAIKKGIDLIYPNPAYDKLQIRFKAALNGQLAVRNVTGQLILERQVTGNESLLDVSQLAAGLYILEIKAEGGIYSASKFMVQH